MYIFFRGTGETSSLSYYGGFSSKAKVGFVLFLKEHSLRLTIMKEQSLRQCPVDLLGSFSQCQDSISKVYYFIYFCPLAL